MATARAGVGVAWREVAGGQCTVDRQGWTRRARPSPPTPCAAVRRGETHHTDLDVRLELSPRRVRVCAAGPKAGWDHSDHDLGLRRDRDLTKKGIQLGHGERVALICTVLDGHVGSLIRRHGLDGAQQFGGGRRGHGENVPHKVEDLLEQKR